MRIILTRHGETEGNLKKILCGHYDDKLNVEGKKQARKLGQRLKNNAIDIIYSSDLKRASDTAREIHKYHLKAPIIFTEKLRERDYGLLTGVKRSDIGFGNEPIPLSFFYRNRNKYKLEDNSALLNRAKEFIDIIYKKHKSDTVVLVSHGTFGRALISVIKGKKRMEKTKKAFGNTAVSIFDIDEDRNHKIILHNCIKHLEE